MSIDTFEKKKSTLNMRVSSSQIDIIETVKAGNPRVSTTDVLMSGVNLLRVLADTQNPDMAGIYNELMNALIIHDDLLRCLAKPENPQINNVKNKAELRKSLRENEKKIIDFIKLIVNNKSTC